MGKRKLAYSELRLMPPCSLYILIGKKQLREFEKRYGEKVIPGNEYDAFTTYVDTEESGRIHAMYLPKGRSLKDPCFAALVAHEACHIVDDYLRSIGEVQTASEQSAYTVQGATQCALWCYKADAKRRKKRRRV